MPGQQKRGGRKVGSVNIKQHALKVSLEQYCTDKNVDPHFYMVDLLADPNQDPSLRFMAAKELAQYMRPKMKAIEHNLAPETRKVVMSWLNKSESNTPQVT
jgi:hypothetical protein